MLFNTVINALKLLIEAIVLEWLNPSRILNFSKKNGGLLYH
jgi:hypothetical protein